MNPIVEFVRSTQALEEIRENILISRFFCRIEDTVLEAESAIDEEADDVRYAFFTAEYQSGRSEASVESMTSLNWGQRSRCFFTSPFFLE